MLGYLARVAFWLTCLGACLWIIGCGGSNEEELFDFELAQLVISEGLNYDFGVLPIGDIRTHTFTIANVGPTTATEMRGSFHITAFDYWGGSFPGQGGDCDGMLEPGESCTIVVAFMPQFVGNYSLPLKVIYFDGKNETATMRPIISGTGIGN